VALLRLTPSFPGAPVVLASCSVLAAAAPLGAATVEAKRSFDLPRGDAATTLRQFAATAGRSLVFVTDKVRGETTNAVRGDFTPREALERMLASSALEAVQDATTGALVVSRKRVAEAAPRLGEAGPVSDPPPKPELNSMISKPRASLAALAAWLVAGAVVDAQTASKPVRDDAVVLSPFTVSTDRDSGFVAASSLAGGRLATDLRDTPVAYSVLTRDFIDALGITNQFDASDWAPNSVKSIAANGGGYGDDVSNAPGTYNVRGAGGGRAQRNFFIYFSPNDAYVVERFDFGRGPNAILFGNGGLGGVSTVTTKQARFGNNFTEIAQTFGSWRNSRTTLDANRALNERIAVRAAAVYADTGGWRDKQFEKVRAAFLTASFKLSRQTTIRAEGEYGESKRNQTFTNLTDQLSGWDGKTTFSGRLDTLPANANALGVTRRGVGYQVINPFSGVDAVMSYRNDPTTLAGGANSQTPLAGLVQGSFPSFASAGANLLYAYNLPGNRFENAIAGSAFRLPSKSFSLASDAPVIQERFKDLQVTVDHRIGDLYLQAAADVNRANQRINNIDVRNSNVMYIDINRVLPNGTANTHFLQPYADGILRRNLNYRNSQGARFAAGYVKDAGRWGRYTFNAMGGTSVNEYLNRAENLSIAQNTDRRRWGASGVALGETDRIRVRRYWNESSRGYYEPTSIRFIDPVNNIDKTINPFWALENDRNDSQQYTRTRFTYGIASINAKFLGNRLVLLGAVRGDDFYNYNRQQTHGGDYDPVNWNGKTVNWKPDGPTNWGTLTYIPKNANGVATGPAVSADTRPRDGSGNRLAQYANDRFKDDYNAPAVKETRVTKTIGAVFHLTKWLSPFANYAETFNPPSAIQRIDSSFLPPTVAKGVDLGLRGTFLDGRIVISALHYKNTEINASFGSTGVGDINAIAAANALGDPSLAGRNIRSFASIPSVLTDLQDREAKGYEFEAVANLSKHWRLSGNVGLPKVYQTNAARDFLRFYAANKDTLRQIVIDAGGLVDSADFATVDTGIPANDRSPDVNGAVNSYNNLRIARQNAVANRRLVQDQPAINLFTDYTLGGTPLKGLRLGGGVNYRGKQIIGFRAADTIVNPGNPLTAIDDPNADAYTPVYSPASYYTVVMTMSYTLRLQRGRTVRLDLRVNNLLNDQGPIFGVSTALRPKNGDLTSPARQTVPNVYSYKTPTGLSLTSTLRF
jgi:outer membrane receptor for ferric coprogen and ferric-rhodotorulic acid